MVTWERDKFLKSFFVKKRIVWQEFQKDNVIRGINNRKGWDEQWYEAMSKPVLINSYSQANHTTIAHPFVPPVAFANMITEQHHSHQPAGETMAWKYLRSFLKDRGFNYQKHISKPRESRLSCGRISPYLAWGNISIKQAYQEVRFHDNFKQAKRAYTAFLTRLKWHCHFIQKFEVENTYETHCVNAGYELLERPYDETVVRAWKEGKTGYPLVDACMRCVIETGWLNFRMRAMVVSFLCHHLDQDWRTGVYFLAQQFLDYDPGIHYPQFQMQAGTTGVNMVRIYNPIKQSQDHDPEGIFIKKWVPELSVVPTTFIHEPWKMTRMDQMLIQIDLDEIYPQPIVDHIKSGQNAKNKIWNHRKQKFVKQEKKRILVTHVRPNNK
jgi:deoxyribodipyrimidine photo-lyase